MVTRKYSINQPKLSNMLKCHSSAPSGNSSSFQEAIVDEMWKFAFVLGKAKVIKGGEVDSQPLGDRIGITSVSNAPVGAS